MSRRVALAFALLGAAACSPAPLPIPVWIDTDPALGEPNRDVR